MSEDNHYRYCFSCEQWKTKEQINEVDAGPQPGGNNGKSYNCDTCRKDLGEICHIFNCHHHPEIILKVCGNLEGVNQEKIFFDKCPKAGEQQIPSNPQKTDWKMISLTIIGVIIVLLALIWFVYYLFEGKERKK